MLRKCRGCCEITWVFVLQIQLPHMRMLLIFVFLHWFALHNKIQSFTHLWDIYFIYIYTWYFHLLRPLSILEKAVSVHQLFIDLYLFLFYTFTLCCVGTSTSFNIGKRRTSLLLKGPVVFIARARLMKFCLLACNGSVKAAKQGSFIVLQKHAHSASVAFWRAFITL